ncbi:(2Fe-2S)-binding protein [Pusillimonas sp. CC-YST705]|uniref:Bacterioferritin-associated ferredoxin n=1 Tax=Mesopusillimonas faecipullorum TaxID=2755040 RepID=A0ABS8CEZ6_9BURK|nr:(2Fe-2S)-binding protein [Mesopusillimonas faecipullorum]MCB5364625.1 (2Fe-2S)-binding protein [Mesopusillimonas faecipullorum]
MFICVCNAITERQVQAAVAAGASTMADLQGELGVATNCGCCMDTALEYLPGGRYATASLSVVSISALSTEVNEITEIEIAEAAANDESVQVGVMRVRSVARRA